MEVLATQMRNKVLHCPSHATIVARKATKPTSANRKTSTRTVEDVLEVEAEDVLVEKMDAVMDTPGLATTRNTTRQTWYASSTEKRALHI